MSLQLGDLEKSLKEVLAQSEVKKKRKFIETVDVIVNLKNVNLKDPNKRFNNEIELPNAVNENSPLCFFVEGDQLVQAGNLKVYAMNKEQMDTMGKAEKATKPAAARLRRHQPRR
jgi:large subunit ribosomal protein L1